jgi:hypothetical protein
MTERKANAARTTVSVDAPGAVMHWRHPGGDPATSALPDPRFAFAG